MSQSSSRRVLDFIILAVLLAGAGFVMYNLLPQVTKPGQEVVPALPPSASDPVQAILTAFIIMTAVGAPVTGAIVLALVSKGISKSIPVNAATPDQPIESQKASAVASKQLSNGEALFWKIVAIVLVLGVVAAIGLAVWPGLARMFS